MPGLTPVRRLNLADGEPFARVTVWCPEDLGAHLSRAQVQERSFYDLLPVAFGGATQRLGECEVTRLHSPHAIEVRDPSTGRHYLISGLDFGPDARLVNAAPRPAKA